MSKLYKRGDTKDNKVFWRYSPYVKINGERQEIWVSKDVFDKRVKTNKEWVDKHMISTNGVYKAYKTKKWAKFLYFCARSNSKQRGQLKDFEITEEWITDQFNIQNKKCYWSGIDLLPTSENNHPQKPSLDRIDGTIGYTKENTVICCLFINLGRKDNNPEVLKEFLLKLKD